VSIREELIFIQGESELLNPKDAVDWARGNPDSYLHGALEWDNDKAADAYRLTQVRRLIAIHIVDDDKPHREWVSLSVDRVEGGGYRKTAEILPVRSLREIMLADAMRELERVQTKYGRLDELCEVWAAKDRVKRRGRRNPVQRGAVEQHAP